MNYILRIRRMPVVAGILLVSNLSYSNTTAIDAIPSDTVPSTQELNELVVNGVGAGDVGKIGHLTMTGAEINLHPALLGEHDVIKALQSTAGVVSGTEGFAGLYVRGGETDQNLYLVDGLPLLNVYHFGGLFSTFSTHSVGNVEFYKGAFPASFGERASSIVDIILKRPSLTRREGVFSIGLISGQLYFSTPLKKDRVALSVSLRRTWFDAFSAPALAIINSTKREEGRKNIFHYNFTDIMVKLRATDGQNCDFSLLLFMGKDKFSLGEEWFDPKVKNSMYKRDVNRMMWGNWGVTADYTLTTPAGRLKIQPYISKAFASDAEENFYSGESPAAIESLTTVAPSVLQTGMKESFSFPITRWLHTDVGLQQTWYDYNVGNPEVVYSGSISEPVGSQFTNHSKNWLLSGFAEFHWSVANIIHGNFGLRLNRFLSDNAKHWTPEPRLDIRFELPNKSSISLGYTRVAQYAQQVTSNYMYLPSDAWLPTASRTKPLISNIYSLGYFKQFKGEFNVKGELWYKNMQNLADFKQNMSVTTMSRQWYDKLTYGKGWAYGLDLEVSGRYKSVDWSVGYGLMWNWRKFADLNDGRRFPAKFDNRHKLDLNVGWKINKKLELTGNWEYMTGNRTTLALYNTATPDYAFPDAPFHNPNGTIDGIDYFEGRNNIRMPSFHRLNLNLKLKGRISDRLTYHWDFGLYNAYCRMNPFTLMKSYVNEDYNSHRGDHRRFKTLSLLPILPSVSFTFNF